jgi:methylthioribose-1-phosphate isomerase
MNENPLETIRLDDENDALVIIDQTLLPNQLKYLHLIRLADIREAIYELRVRGAPAIGIAAGYGAYLAMKNSDALHYLDFLKAFLEVKQILATARPTAVNLFWALGRLENIIRTHKDRPIDQIKQALLLEANHILAEDIRTNRAIGEFGLSLLKPSDGILTHCNAGALATGGYGTATAPIYLGQERAYNFKVYADETRPLLQGARLTTFELARAGIDVTLICDNMAATVMQNGQIQAVLVGCDRVAANGDTANKIGTAGVAILANHFNIPFYVCAPSSTIDKQTPTGADIEIEQRPAQEIYKKWYSQTMAPESGVNFFNPAFDVTSAGLITAFITDQGIFRPPYDFS